MSSRSCVRLLLTLGCPAAVVILAAWHFGAGASAIAGDEMPPMAKLKVALVQAEFEEVNVWRDGSSDTAGQSRRLLKTVSVATVAQGKGDLRMQTTQHCVPSGRLCVVAAGFAIAFSGFASSGCNRACTSSQGDAGIGVSTFNDSQWRSGDARLRGAMVDDLVQRQDELVIGRSRAQVQELLGSCDSSTASPLEYEVDLGHRFGGSPWLYTLKVEFDESGNATSVLLLD